MKPRLVSCFLIVFVDIDKETVTVKVANDEIKAYMETVFTKATIVVDSTLAE